MKKLISIVFALLIILVPFKVYADSDIAKVVDDADIFDSEEEIELNNLLTKVSNKYGIDVIVLSSEDTMGLDSTNYADAFYDNYGYGSNGIVLFYDFDNSILHLHPVGDVFDLMSDSDVDLLLGDYMFDYVNSGEYTKATGLYIAKLDEYLAQLFNVSSANTYSVPLIEGNPRVVDLADVLSSQEEDELDILLKQLSSKHMMDIIVVSTDEANGLSSMDYADDFYDYNNYQDDGVLLLYDFDNRKVYISTKGLGITYITDYSIDLLLGDYMFDYFLDKEYLKSSKLYLNKLDEILSYGEQGNIIDVNNHIPTKFTVTNVAIGLVIGAVTSLVYILILKGQLKSVSKQYFASNYIDDGSFRLNGRADFFTGKHVSKTRIERKNSSSGGSSFGGGSSSHTSSSGSRHGGGGRSF